MSGFQADSTTDSSVKFIKSVGFSVFKTTKYSVKYFPDIGNI